MSRFEIVNVNVREFNGLRCCLIAFITFTGSAYFMYTGLLMCEMGQMYINHSVQKVNLRENR